MYMELDRKYVGKEVTENVKKNVKHLVYIKWICELKKKSNQWDCWMHRRRSLLGRAGSCPPTFQSLWAKPILCPPTFCG